jgi:hypothetical protein
LKIKVNDSKSARVTFTLLSRIPQQWNHSSD